MDEPLTCDHCGYTGEAVKVVRTTVVTHSLTVQTLLFVLRDQR